MRSEITNSSLFIYRNIHVDLGVVYTVLPYLCINFTGVGKLVLYLRSEMRSVFICCRLERHFRVSNIRVWEQPSTMVRVIVLSSSCLALGILWQFNSTLKLHFDNIQYHSFRYAHYDNNTSFTDFVSFGGWTSPYAKQYAGTSTVCG